MGIVIAPLLWLPRNTANNYNRIRNHCRPRCEPLFLVSYASFTHNIFSIPDVLVPAPSPTDESLQRGLEIPFVHNNGEGGKVNGASGANDTRNAEGASVSSEVNSSRELSPSPLPPAPVLAELASESPPQAKVSIPLRAPPHDAYSNTVVMTRRKSTDPILYSDPYPYSLSTPGSELVEPANESSEESSSPSSSSQDKESDDKEPDNRLSDEYVDEDEALEGTDDRLNDDSADEDEELELRYPSEVAEGPTVTVKLDGHEDNNDANGDADPAFVEVADTFAPLPAPAETVPDPLTDYLFKLMGNKRKIAPHAVENDSSVQGERVILPQTK